MHGLDADERTMMNVLDTGRLPAAYANDPIPPMHLILAWGRLERRGLIEHTNTLGDYRITPIGRIVLQALILDELGRG